MREILDNVVNVLAIEIMAAAQGIDFLKPLLPGKGTVAAHKAVRAILPHLEKDRFLSPEIKAIHDFIVSGQLVEIVEAETGSLKV